jgi:hypothetical protein
MAAQCGHLHSGLLELSHGETDHGTRAHRVALVGGVKTELDPIHVEVAEFLYDHHGRSVAEVGGPLRRHHRRFFNEIHHRTYRRTIQASTIPACSMSERRWHT